MGLHRQIIESGSESDLETTPRGSAPLGGNSKVKNHETRDKGEIVENGQASATYSPRMRGPIGPSAVAELSLRVESDR